MGSRRTQAKTFVGIIADTLVSVDLKLGETFSFILRQAQYGRKRLVSNEPPFLIGLDVQGGERIAQ